MADYAPVQETLAPAAGPPIDPDVLEQRRKLAQALIAQAMGGEPIGSWTQGVAKLAQALMGGYNVRKINQQEAAGRTSGAADTAAILAEIAAGAGGGGGGGGAAGGGAYPMVTGDPTGGGKADLAAMTPEEAIVRTVAGEAAGEPPEGQAAVASVILNRAKKAGQSPQQIVLAKNQFEPWSRNPQRLMALTRGSPKYQQILANIQPALQGQDVTGGATHFYAPKAQAALGRNTPAWARGPYQDIGNHRFYKLAGGPLGQSETAALPNVQPVGSEPSPDVLKFLGADRWAAGQQTPETPEDQARAAQAAALAPQLLEAVRKRNVPQQPPSPADREALLRQVLGGSANESPADVAAEVRRYYGNEPQGLQPQPPTAALPNVDPMGFRPSPDVMKFLGGGDQPQPARLSIGDGSVAPVPPGPDLPMGRVKDLPVPPVPPLPRPRPDPFMRAPPPPLPTPLPPVQPVARAPQPRPEPPAPAPAPVAAAPAPATTGSIAPQPQPQPRRQIFREPSSGAPLSAQEFARQGQNYLTGRGSFANQTPRVAPRTMQEPIAGAPLGAPPAPVAAAPAQPRRGLLQALLGRGGPQAPAAGQPAPAGSPVAAPVAAGATAAGAGGMSSRVSALLANPYVSDAVKSAVLNRLLPKPGEGFTLGANEKRYDDKGNLIATGGAGERKIQNDANGVPRYTDTGEPVYAGDAGTGGEFFTGKSVEAQGLNYLLNQGILTKEQAANVAAGKTITAADGSLIFMTPAGIVRKPPGSDATGGDDGGYVISGPKTAGTEAETKAGGFADRMHESGRIIDSLEAEGTSLAGKAVGDIPILGNYLVSDKYRQYQQAQRDFINSQLRRESGAVISDAEFENAKKQYFPQPNDDAKTIANKRRNRALAVEGMKRSAGPLYKPAPEEAPEATSAPDASAPGLKDNPVRIGTQADYDRLPSGAYYVDDDGSIKVKS